MTKKRKLLAVIDGKSVFYRGYYAMPGLSLPDGTPTGGVYGFASLALELIKKLEPDYVAVAWDKPKTNIRKRREMYPEYKAGRKAPPEDFYAQIPILHELLDAFSWPFYELDDYEADDILGAFAMQAHARDIDTALITSDLDALQLVNAHTKVYAMKNGLANLEEYDVAALENKLGIKHEQFLDLKALKGDSSDNLPGVPGVGEKTAVKLLQDYGTLDGVYQHTADLRTTLRDRLHAGKELAYMTKKVGKLWVDAPVELDFAAADVRDADGEQIAAILEKLAFTSLLRRLPANMRGPVYLHATDECIYAYTASDTIYQLEWASEMSWLDGAKVVAWDLKQLHHRMHAHDVDAKFGDVYDVNQAAFLLDPLARERTLEALMGQVVETPEHTLQSLHAVHARQLKKFEELPRLHAVARDMDFPLAELLARMERRGIKMDQTHFERMQRDLDAKIVTLEQKIYTSVGQEFNIGSPKQLGVILFDVLGLPTAGVKKGKNGVYSTNAKVLERLQPAHPVVDMVVVMRELSKLKSTYVDALPKLADERGRIHTHLNQDVTATGRLSSTNPNLQNIPVRTDVGREIRRGFIPEPGHVYVGADYSQFELRLAAVLAGDTELVENFNNNVDIHVKTASEVYDVPIDQVSADQRRAAKVINFGVLYGMSPHGLAAATGMDFTEAKAFIDQYFAVRGAIREYMHQTLEKARTDGYVETLYGRRRPTPDVTSSNFMVRQGAERAATNMPIQGTEADLMKLAMLQVESELGDLGEQILQVHDSILVETPEAHADEVGEILRACMQNVAPDLGVKLKVDVKVGRSWYDV